MTTTNDLIGYDPLAWMDGADIEEETPPAPVKKVTKSKAKTKTAPVETVEEPVVVSESDEEVQAVEGEIVHDEPDEIEVDVTVAEDGEIEISIEASEDKHVSVEVSVTETESAESEEPVVENVTADAISQEDTTQTLEEPVTEEMTQETAVQESVILEEPTEKEPAKAVAEPHVDLETDASIKNVAELYAKLKDSLAAHDSIEINAADVASIDTATLQLLVSLKKDAPNLGKTVEIIYPSERFIESAKLLGLLDILDVSAS